ncbi:MAG: two pore domain potassium channel family protein [Spirochaetes bacterium]|nr:two pore domain potassium channel family protein [Spirochaetota bacterium]
MKRYRFRLKIYIGVFLMVMAVGIVGFMTVEGKTFFDSLYFTIVTVATVGYGDIHPTTTAGEAIAIMVILFGTGTFLGVIATATEMMLAGRDERTRHEKLNIVTGLFFSEIGMELLRVASMKDHTIDSIREKLAAMSSWSPEDIASLKLFFDGHASRLAPDVADFQYLKGLLKEGKYLMIQLLENPAVVEHELFTDILRAAFHLTEELSHRTDLTDLPPSDLEHLKGDLKRVYDLLIRQWIDYMRYLKQNYPYLFSLAVRTNPFVPQRSPWVIQ